MLTINEQMTGNTNPFHFEPCIQPTATTGLPTSVPNKTDMQHFVEAMVDFLFPNNRHQLLTAAAHYAEIMDQLKHLLCPLAVDADAIIEAFVAALPTIRDRLLEDAQAALELDPAATSLDEVIFAYPGFFATAVYRLAHELQQLDVPLLPRMIAEYAHSKTGIDIHPAAQIGRAFVIDHGTGTVIGATTQIGNHVTLYHGVTLGALHVEKSLASIKRHPTIEDHVTIYANATVLGGNTVIGHHSILGGNTWVMKSILPYSRVYYKSQSTMDSADQSTLA